MGAYGYNPYASAFNPNTGFGGYGGGGGGGYPGGLGYGALGGGGNNGLLGYGNGFNPLTGYGGYGNPFPSPFAGQQQQNPYNSDQFDD